MAENELKVRITGDGAQFKAAIDGAKRDIGDFGRVGTGAIGAVTRVLGPLGIALSAAGFAQLSKQVIDNADQMGKFAQKAGIAVETLSALDYAAKASDVSTGELATSIKFLNKSLVESQDSSSEIAKLFTAMGVSAVDGAGHLRSADAVLLDLAEVFKALPDGAEKSGLALKLFGKAGEGMIPFLNEGKAGISALTAEAERLGAVVGSDMAKAADEFNDNFDRLKSSLFGFANTVLPPVIDGMNRLNELLGNGGSAAPQSASDWTLDKIKERQAAIAALNSELDSIGRGTHLSSLIGRDAEEIKQEIADQQKAILEYAKLREGAMKFEEEAAKGVKAPSAAAVGKVLAGGKPGKPEKIFNPETDSDIRKAREEMIALYRDAYPLAMQSSEEWGQQQAEEAKQWLASQESAEAYGERMMQLAKVAYPAATETAEEYGERMKELAEAQLAAAKNGDEVAQIYKDTATSIRGAFRDTFRDIFDNGVDGFKHFGDRLLNIFKDLLADMATMTLARPVIVPLVSGLGGLLGVPGDAQASVLQQLGGNAIGGGLSAAGTFGTGMMAGLNGGFGAASSLGGMGATTFGAYAGAALPWIGGALALNAITGGGLFGTKWKTKDSGYNLDYSGGDVSGTTYIDQAKKKRFFRGGASQTISGAIDPAILAEINATFDGIEAGIVKGAQGLGLTTAEEFLAGFTTGAKVSLSGKSAEDAKAAVAEWIGNVTGEMYSQLLKGTALEGLLRQFETSKYSSSSRYVGNNEVDGRYVVSGSVSTAIDKDSVKAMGDALFAIGGYFSSDAIADMLGAKALADRTLKQRLAESYTSLRDLASVYDGSIEATQRLASATQERYALELQYAEQINAIKREAVDSLQGSIESIRRSVMSKDELYSYLTGQANTLSGQLGTASDPAQIQQLVAQINTLTNEAYGLLVDGAKQENSQAFIDFLAEVQGTATQRLDSAAEQSRKDQQQLAAIIETTMNAVAQQMKAAADAQLAAAQEQLRAAQELRRANEAARNNY